MDKKGMKVPQKSGVNLVSCCRRLSLRKYGSVILTAAGTLQIFPSNQIQRLPDHGHHDRGARSRDAHRRAFAYDKQRWDFFAGIVRVRVHTRVVPYDRILQIRNKFRPAFYTLIGAANPQPLLPILFHVNWQWRGIDPQSLALYKRPRDRPYK